VVLPGIFDATAYQNAQESEKTLMTLNGVQIQIESKRLHEGSMNGVMLILALQERSE
jgi:hypothetical protein